MNSLQVLLWQLVCHHFLDLLWQAVINVKKTVSYYMQDTKDGSTSVSGQLRTYPSPKTWCMLLRYTSVTPCVCTNLLLREWHSFGATAQGKIKKGTNKAWFRHRQDTYLALFRTVQAHFRHSLSRAQGQFRHRLGTVQAHNFYEQLGMFLGQASQ